MGPDRHRLQYPDQLNSRSSPSVASCLPALPSDQTDPRIDGSLTLSPQCADWGSETDACARRSDVHEEASVKTGARRWRDLPDIHSASSAMAEHHERVCGRSHSIPRRRAAPRRTSGCDLSPALDLDGPVPGMSHTGAWRVASRDSGSEVAVYRSRYAAYRGRPDIDPVSEYWRAVLREGPIVTR
jgi:hypothetical protein